MLNGEDFRGRHQRSLRSVLDSDHRDLQRDNGFAAAHVPLQESIHRHRFFQVRNNLSEHAFLRFRRLEREDTLQRFADAVFAHAKGDGIFPSRRSAIQTQAELVQKKLLKNQPLLRGGLKSV